MTSKRGQRQARVARGVLSVVLLGLAGTPAWAAPAAPSASPTAEPRPESSRAPEPDKEQARALFREGLSLLDAEQRVWLNDEELTVAAGQEIRVEPGEYTLRIAHPRTPPEARAIAVWPGELLRVDASRPRAPKPLPVVTPRDEPEAKTASATARSDSRVFVLARADVDVARRGAVGAAGVAVAVQDFLRLTGGALLGAHQGLWLGLELVPSRHWIAPVLGLSAPLFFVDGARPGGSAELGLRVEVSRRLAPFARVSVTHFPHVPADYVRTLIIPSVGLEAGL